MCLCRKGKHTEMGMLPRGPERGLSTGGEAKGTGHHRCRAIRQRNDATVTLGTGRLLNLGKNIGSVCPRLLHLGSQDTFSANQIPPPCTTDILRKPAFQNLHSQMESVAL